MLKRKIISILKRNWRQVYILLAVVTDSAAIWVSTVVAYWIRNDWLNMPALSPTLALNVFLLSWISFILFASVLGLYRAAYHAHRNEQYAIGFKAYIYTIPAIIMLMYVLKVQYFPLRFMLIFLLMTPVAFAVGRRMLNLFNGIMQKAGYGTFNALIVGFNGVGDKIIQTYEKVPHLGCRIKGIVEVNNHHARNRAMSERLSIPRYNVKRLEEAVRKEAVDHILVPSIDDAADMPELLETCREKNIDLKILSPEFDDLTRYTHVHDVAGIPLFSRRRRLTERLKRYAKRVFDILGSMIALIISAPLILISAAAIYIEDGKPIFFRQRRALAEGAREIKVFKFRTMKKDAEAQQQELYKRNKNTGGLFFMDHDPRVTKIGRILRKFSIDEIPQFFNVFFGQMSLVGPRPLMLADLKNITPENRMRGYYELRANAKPGVTGLWQISGRREVSFKEMVLLDLYYIENMSIMFDIEILFATINVVLFGKGAH